MMSLRYRCAALVGILLFIAEVHSQERRCRQRPMDIVFILDGSRSVRPHNFRIVQDVVKRMVDTFEYIGPEDTQIGLIQYSSRVRQEFPLNQYYTKEEVKQAIDSIRYLERGTMTGEALKFLTLRTMTKENGARMEPEVLKVAVVITDGRAQDRTVPLWQQRAKDAGIVLFAIGIGRRISDKDLLLIASEPKAEHMFYAENFEAFKSIQVMLAEEVCDVDECVIGNHTCTQICINTFGSFACDCFDDFMLEEDGSTCVQKTTNTCDDAGCEYRCLPVPPFGFRCVCPPGQKLNRDELTCRDLDTEPCAEAKCEYLCEVVPPEGFRCICPPGEKLNRDEITCTSAAKKAPAPQNLRFSEITHTSMKVSWDLDDPKRADAVKHYVVAYYRSDGQGERRTMETPVAEAVLENLEPGVEYTVLVSAVTDTDFSPSAQGKETTLFLGETELTLSDPSLTTLTARWQPAGGDRLSGYSLVLNKMTDESGVGVSPGHNRVYEVGSDVHEQVIRDLEPGTRYHGRVTPMHGKLTGGSGQDTETTRDLTPPDVDIVKTTLSTADVMWTNSGTFPQTYTVSYCPTGRSGEKKVFDTEDISTRLTGLDPGTEYKVEVVGHVFDDDKSFTTPPGSDTDTTKSLTAPAVRATPRSWTSARVRWGNVGMPVDHYTIRYNPVGRPEEVTSITAGPEETETMLTTLEHDTQYEVSVVGVVLEDDKTFTSPVGRDTFTLGALDPPNVEIPSTTETTLDATWTDNVDADDYRLNIRRVDGQGDPIPPVTVSGDVSHITFPSLTPGTEYEVSVVTQIVDEGTLIESPPGRARGITRPAPPENLKVTEDTPTSLTVTFDPSKGGKDWYEAKCVPTGEHPDDYEPIRVETDDLTFTCKDLIPGIDYDIHVITVFRELKSDPARTSTQTAVGPPMNFDLSQPTTHTIVATWEPPAEVEEVTEYIVTYRSPVHGTAEEIRVPGTETRLVLVNLFPDTLYVGSIRAVVNSFITPTAGDSETTLPDDISIRVTEVDYSTIRLEWPQSRVPHTVSTILTYVPQQEDESAPDTSDQLDTVMLDPGQTTYLIRYAKPATIYDITLQYLYPRGYRSDIARTTAATLAPPPGPITFMNVTTVSFVMEWGRPEYEADPIGYTVQYAPTGGETVVDIEVPSGEVLYTDVDGLEESTTYNVSVVANYRYGIVSEATRGEETTLSPPDDFTGQCSCKTYMKAQRDITSTLERLVNQISRLNAKIERMESASFSGAEESVNRYKRQPE